MQFYLIDPSNPSPSFEEKTIRETVFSNWEKMWSNIYSEAGSPESFKLDDFFRQHCVGVLLEDSKFVAAHLYTFFNLNCKVALSHSYFNFYDNDFIEEIKKKGAEVAMTMEFMTVVPEYRKTKTSVSYAIALANLGARYFKNSIADVIVAPARKDVGVDRIAYSIGFDCIQKDILQRNFNCDMVALFKENIRNPENPELLRTLNALWQGRIDFNLGPNLIDKNLPAAA